MNSGTTGTNKSPQDLGKEFRKAADEGDLAKVLQIFHAHPEVINLSGPETGQTALHRAVNKGHLEVTLFLLLQSNIELTSDKNNKTPFDHLLKKIADKNSQHYYSFLFYFIELLAKKMSKAPEEIRNGYFMERLKTIPAWNQDALAEVNAFNEANKTKGKSYNETKAYMNTMSLTLKSAEITPIPVVHTIMRNNNITYHSTINGIPLFYIGTFFVADRQTQLARVLGFLKPYPESGIAGANINCKNTSLNLLLFESTLLHTILANEGCFRTIDIINEIDKLRSANSQIIPIDYTTTDGEQKTLLHLAVRLRKPDMVNFLLTKMQQSLTSEQIANIINTPDCYGIPMLHIAYLFGDVKTMDLLLKNGANPNIKDKYGKTLHDLRNESSELLNMRVNLQLRAIQINPNRGENSCGGTPYKEEQEHFRRMFPNEGRPLIDICGEKRSALNKDLNFLKTWKVTPAADVPNTSISANFSI
jgi:ankyrin repeat protein